MAKYDYDTIRNMFVISVSVLYHSSDGLIERADRGVELSVYAELRHGGGGGGGRARAAGADRARRYQTPHRLQWQSLLLQQLL